MGRATWIVPSVGVVVGAAALLGSLRHDRLPSSMTPRDAIRVVIAGRDPGALSHGQALAPTAAVDTKLDWTGPERDAVLNALALTKDARVRDVTPFAQTLCGQVQVAPGQAFRRFAYARSARLGALDDGGAEFARTFADLCR